MYTTRRGEGSVIVVEALVLVLTVTAEVLGAVVVFAALLVEDVTGLLDAVAVVGGLPVDVVKKPEEVCGAFVVDVVWTAVVVADAEVPTFAVDVIWTAVVVADPDVPT